MKQCCYRARRTIGLLILLSLAGVCWGDPAPATQSTSALASRPVNSGFADQGTFALCVNEDRVALMEGKLSADGSLENNATLTISGLSVHLSTKITADKNGEWQKIESQSPVGMVTMERDGQQVRIIA